MLKLFEIISIEKATNMNAVVLAYVGDAVYSLYMRKVLALEKDCKSGQLHKIAAQTVSAVNQSQTVDKILPHLTEDELNIYKRARNAKKNTRAKNSTTASYNRSTGFEAIIGYLYLIGQFERLEQLLTIGESL